MVNGLFPTHKLQIFLRLIPRSYSLVKLIAEQELLILSRRTALDVVILRPPLIYGSKSKGNFKSLIDLMQRRIPMPLGSIKSNRRSMLFIGNLIDLIVTTLTHPAALGRCFVLSDDDDVSTYDLIQKIAFYLSIKPLLLPFNTHVLRVLAISVNKSHIYDKLCSSLRVDSSNTFTSLSFKPKFSMDQGLESFLFLMFRQSFLSLNSMKFSRIFF